MGRSAAISQHRMQPVKWPAPSRSRMKQALRMIDMRPGRVGDLVPVRRLSSFRRPPRVASGKTFATR
jgi:hypothetical protein